MSVTPRVLHGIALCGIDSARFFVRPAAGLYWIIVTRHYSNIIRALRVFMRECAAEPGGVFGFLLCRDRFSAVLCAKTKAALLVVFAKTAVSSFFWVVVGVCPGCPGSFMSSYTGPLLLPRGAPVSVAGRQPFNDLQGRLSQCGQVRALCITTHRSPLTTDGFPQPQPATFKISRLRPGRNAASCTWFKRRFFE